MTMPKDNPYLAHRHPTERAVSSASALNGASASSREPLYGFVPRMVNADQVRQALEHDLNPFTKQPHTAQYKKILEARKKLPVFAQMTEFYK
ncbi:hypothetical protein BDR07DRAFT_890944 [Suillus spraguei]|nr:hypothetical protein BDR07DRAFT_890944 [Suillus spraguei]